MILLLAAAAFAQSPAGPKAGTPPVKSAADLPISKATRAFRACIDSKAGAVPASVTPEAGADLLIKQCEPERAKMEATFEAMIAPFPQPVQVKAREEYRAGMADGRRVIVEGLRKMRETKTK